MIRDRIQKVCDSFMGSRFEIPGLGENLFAQLEEVRRQVMTENELKKVSKRELANYLRSINGDHMTAEKPSQLEVMLQFVVRERVTYMTLNMFLYKTQNDQ